MVLLGTSCPMNFAGAQCFFLNSFTGLVCEQLTVASRDNMYRATLGLCVNFLMKKQNWWLIILVNKINNLIH